MANAVEWTGATTRSDLLPTQMDALSAGSISAAGSELDNATNKDQYGTIVISVQFASAPSAGGYVAVYAIEAPDGTNYDTLTSANDPGAHRLVATIRADAVNTAQRLISNRIELHPFKTKFIVKNGTSQAFPSSAIFDLYTYNDEIQ